MSRKQDVPPEAQRTKRPESFGAARRWMARLHVLISVVLAFYILLVVNLIVFRHPARFDLTAERQHTLSDATRKRLESVNQEIRIVFPFFLQRENPEHVATSGVLRRARAVRTARASAPRQRRARRASTA